MSVEKPFAVVIRNIGESFNPSEVRVDGRQVIFPFEMLGTLETSHAIAERLNAAHESRCTARERAAAAKALREASIDIATRSTTVFDAVSVLRARADAVERGE